MAMNPKLYTGRQAFPERGAHVEVIAYERRDGGWDAFLFEPPGVLPPDWEAARLDPQHVNLGPVSSPAELQALADRIRVRLGPDYEPVFAFREAEAGERVRINRALSWLKKAGATGYHAQCLPDGRFEMWLRRKDWGVLRRAGLVSDDAPPAGDQSASNSSR